MLTLQFKLEKNNNKLRKQGLVPGIIYGKEIEKPFVVKYQDLEKIMRQGSFFNKLLTVELNGQQINTLPKHTQAHVVNDTILHLELQEIATDDIVKVKIPVQCINQDKNDIIKLGGKIHKALNFIQIKCATQHLPEAILLDVSNLQARHTIDINHLNTSNNITILHPAHQTIIKLKAKRQTATETKDSK